MCPFPHLLAPWGGVSVLELHWGSRLLLLAREEDDETRWELGISETLWGIHLHPGLYLCRAPAQEGSMEEAVGCVGLLCALKPL